MAVIFIVDEDGREAEPITDERPFPVKVQNTVPVHGSIHDTGLIHFKGIDTSDAYTAGDAMGVQFAIALPFTEAVLYSATFYDLDDEGLEMHLFLSESLWESQIADDAPMSVDDADLPKILDLLKFSSFEDFTTGQISRLRNIGLALKLPKPELHLQLETIGAPTIAEGSLPLVRLTFLVDK